MAVIAPIVSQFDPKGVKDAEKAFQGLAKQLKGYVGTAAMLAFGKAAISAAEESQQAAARIQQVVKQMALFQGEAAGAIARMDEYAQTVSRATGIDDEQIAAIQAKLLTFRSLAESADEVGGAFDRATKAAIDLAAAGFGDAASNALLLAKALENPTKGLQRLERAIGPLTAAQRKNIETLLAQNDLLGAQRALLDAVEGRVGGTAEATATSSAKLKVAFDQLAETVGGVLLPIFQKIVTALQFLIDQFAKLPAGIQSVVVVGALLAVTFGKVRQALIAVKVSASTANLALGALAIATEIWVAATTDGAKEAEANITEYARSLSTASDEALLASDGITKLGKVLLKVDRDRYYKLFVEGNITAARRLLDLKIASGAAKEEIDALALAIYNYNAGTATAAAETARYGDSQTTTADQTQELIDAQNKVTESINKVRDAYFAALDAKLSYFDQEFALRASIRETSKAEADFRKLQDEVTKGTYKGSDATGDLAQAQDDFLQSALRTAAIQSDIAKATDSTIDPLKVQIDVLTFIAGTLDPNAPLRVNLQGYIDQLLALKNVGVVNPLITVLRTRTQTEVGGILNEVRANGGNVYGGQPYIVGERGMEAFVPKSDGYIIPNSALRGSSPTSGSVVNITVNGAIDAASTARQIRELLQQDGRRLGLLTPVPA